MLWQVQPDDTLRFRCHVGHAYTAEAWEGAQTEHLEQALWSAVRVMEEKVAFARQLASRRMRQGSAAGAERYTTYAQQLEHEVTLIRELILKGTLLHQLAAGETDNSEAAAVPTTKGDEGY